MDMSEQDFSRALVWAAHFVKLGTQDELNLAGIGESTLHPKFVDFVREARQAVGPNVKLIMATNGLIHDENMIAAVQPYNLRVFVSLHRPEKAGLAVSMWRKYGLLDGVSADPSINANDWAGQVEWKNDTQVQMWCTWLAAGRVMAMADGRLTACCLDASGAGVVGHVNDPVGSLSTQAYKLCKTCHHVIINPGWDQKNGVATP